MIRPLLFSIVLLIPAAAGAAEPEAHRLAAASFEQAQAAFARREYAAAAAAFEQAARFEPHPSPLLDAEEAWELAGDAVRAAIDCDAVLAMDAAPNFRDEATKRLARLTPKIATLDLSGPRTTTARIDGGDESRLPARARVAPGHHAIAFTDVTTQAARSVEVDVKGGEARAVDASTGTSTGTETGTGTPTRTLAPTPTPTPTLPPPPPSPPPATWLSFSLSAAATLTAATFGALTLHSKSTFDSDPHPTHDEADAFHRNATITDVAIGAAVLAAGVGVVLWVTAPRAGHDAIALSPSGVGVRW